jgi:outer membrane protein insertion porin family
MTVRRTVRSFLLAATLCLSGVVSLWGQDTAQLSVRVDSVVVRGNERHTAVEIINRSGLRTGSVVQFPQIQDAIRRLFSTGDYADVEIRVTPGTPAVFFIDVVERPYVSSYLFQGLENVSEGMIRDTIGLARNAPLDPDRVSRARALMLRVLSNEGFPTARIDTTVQPDPARPGDLILTFRVVEGPRLGIVQIAFEGNEAFSDGQLRSAMATDQEGFLWFNSGELKRDDYRRDLGERLPEFYESYGYLDFQVLGDTVISDPTTGKGRILIRVDEGRQYLLEDLRIVGNRRFPSARLEEIARNGQREPEEGEERAAYNRGAFIKATGTLGDLYRNSGFLRAAVIPDEQKLPPASPGESPRVIAVWNIREGEPAYVREVRIVGNTYTHDRVIRNRLFLFPGDVYSQDRLIRSVESIQALGFFEQLPPQEAIDFRERADGDIDITFRVKEKQTGMVNFGITAAGATGFAGFIGYEQPNLFGQAKVGRFRWIFGSRQQDLEISYSDPEIFQSRTSGTLALRNSRDRFIGFSLGDRRQAGGFVEFGRPLFGLRSTRVFLGYSLFRDKVTGIDTVSLSPATQELITQGTRSTISLRLVQDTRNNPIFPTAGNRNSISARITGGALGGDGDYQKIDLVSEWFVPVAELGGGVDSNPMQFTFGLAFGAGVILGDNPFFTERYFMGGVQAGQRVRGYEEATITPIGHVPRNAPVSDVDRVGEAYFRTGATFGLRLTSSIFASTFIDAGNTWRRAGELNPTDLLVGAGLGVSLVTPFGPIGVDYAYGFDRRDVVGRPDPGWQLHFKFGQIF